MASSHDGPPDHLDSALELDPRDWEAREVYLVLSALVAPRPIAWVSTVGSDGVRNLAPHSFFNILSIDPPHVLFVSTGVKDTLINVRASGEFVVNIVTMDLVEEMNATAADAPAAVDEFDWVDLDASDAVTVAAPRVSRAKAHLECRAVHEVTIGNGTLVVGEVTHLHVDPSVWSQGRVDPQRLDPVGRLAGTRYARLGEIFPLPRPSWADVSDASPAERIYRRED